LAQVCGIFLGTGDFLFKQTHKKKLMRASNATSSSDISNTSAAADSAAAMKMASKQALLEAKKIARENKQYDMTRDSCSEFSESDRSDRETTNAEPASNKIAPSEQFERGGHRGERHDADKSTEHDKYRGFLNLVRSITCTSVLY